MKGKYQFPARCDREAGRIYTNYFIPLVETTAEHFRLRDVSADKAYLSRKNLKAVEQLGGTPFVPFKKNTLEPTIEEETPWAKMYYYFMYNRLNFMEHYHVRSNIESAFSVIKGKFGDSVRSNAAGRLDGYYERGIWPWDLAAGSVIVEEARGRLTNYRGDVLDLADREIVASNRRLHSAMTRLIGEDG